MDHAFTPEDWNELRHALKRLVTESPVAKRMAISVAEWLVETASAVHDEVAPPPVVIAPEPPPPVRREVLRADVAAAALEENLRRNSMVSPAEATPVSGFAFVPTRPLELLAKRSRLKGEAMRWAKERRGLEIAPDAPHLALNERTQRLIVQANQLDACGLWMLSREADLPPDESMHILAACFDNLALAVDLASALDAKDWEDRDTLFAVFEIVAESQSALRRALVECDLPADEEQTHVFYWLRRQTEQHSVRLDRYMRLDNPADPADWEARSRRLHELEQRLANARNQRRTQLEMRKRLAYHAKRIRNATPGAEFVLDDWHKVDATAAALLGLGVRPSERELREELLAILDLRPNQLDLPESVRPIYNEIDRYLASKEFDSPPPPPARERSPAVQKVADHLRGKRIVLIGGVERPHSKLALERAFELQELEWISTREHESTAYLEAPIARDDTFMVLVLIRWASHSHSKDSMTLAKQLHKRPVRLTRGYNPNQVAEEILRQQFGE